MEPFGQESQNKIMLIKQEIVSEKKPIAELDLSNENNVEALIQAINERNKIIDKLDFDNEIHKKIVAEWVSREPQNFTKLPAEKYFEKIAMIFLGARLKSTDSRDTRYISKALNGLPVLTFHYRTGANEEIEYFDSDLEMPTSLKMDLLLKIKINSALDLINTIDTDINTLNTETVVGEIRKMLVATIRKVVYEYVSVRKIGYYHLVAEFGKIADEILFDLNKMLVRYGSEVGSCHINSMSIPMEILAMMEEEAFSIKKNNTKIEAENKYARLSLAQFERKASILRKYEIPEGLTEQEKDKALERYLTRIRNEKDEKSFKKEVTNEVREEKFELVMPVKPVLADKPTDPSVSQSKSKSALGFSLLAVVFILAGILLIVMELTAAGIAVLAVGVVLGILAAIKLVNKKKDKEKNEQIYAEYLEKMKIYEEQEKVFKESMKRYEEELADYNARLAKHNRR